MGSWVGGGGCCRGSWVGVGCIGRWRRAWGTDEGGWHFHRAMLGVPRLAITAVVWAVEGDVERDLPSVVTTVSTHEAFSLRTIGVFVVEPRFCVSLGGIHIGILERCLLTRGSEVRCRSAILFSITPRTTVIAFVLVIAIGFWGSFGSDCVALSFGRSLCR